MVTLSARLSGHLLKFWVLVLSAVIGLLLVEDYAVSWDAPEEIAMGSEALRAYSASQDYFSLEATSIHGPAYYMLFVAISRSIQAAFPSWSLMDSMYVDIHVAFLPG